MKPLQQYFQMVLFAQMKANEQYFHIMQKCRSILVCFKPERPGHLVFLHFREVSEERTDQTLGILDS